MLACHYNFSLIENVHTYLLQIFHFALAQLKVQGHPYPDFRSVLSFTVVLLFNDKLHVL